MVDLFWDQNAQYKTAGRPVSGYRTSLQKQSPENGNNWINGRRLSSIWPTKSGHWEYRDCGAARESPHSAGISAIPAEKSLKARLVGWGCSADRTRLDTNSLLTGNFTGNVAILGL